MAGISQQAVFDAFIRNGQSQSDNVDLGGYRLVGLSIPATFEPTTVSFLASFDGSTWNPVFDANGTEVTATVSTSRRVVLSPANFYGLKWVRVRGGTAASPTTVAADRTVRLIAEA